jgi:hypothetical protein
MIKSTRFRANQLTASITNTKYLIDARTQILEPQPLPLSQTDHVNFRQLIDDTIENLGEIIRIIPMLRKTAQTAADILFRGVTAYLQKEDNDTTTIGPEQRQALERAYLNIIKNIRAMRPLAQKNRHMRHNLGVFHDYVKETIGSVLGYVIY